MRYHRFTSPEVGSLSTIDPTTKYITDNSHKEAVIPLTHMVFALFIYKARLWDKSSCSKWLSCGVAIRLSGCLNLLICYLGHEDIVVLKCHRTDSGKQWQWENHYFYHTRMDYKYLFSYVHMFKFLHVWIYIYIYIIPKLYFYK